MTGVEIGNVPTNSLNLFLKEIERGIHARHIPVSLSSIVYLPRTILAQTRQRLGTSRIKSSSPPHMLLVIAQQR